MQITETIPKLRRNFDKAFASADHQRIVHKQLFLGRTVGDRQIREENRRNLKRSLNHRDKVPVQFDLNFDGTRLSELV
jgi:hypothetical protein